MDQESNKIGEVKVAVMSKVGVKAWRKEQQDNGSNQHALWSTVVLETTKKN